jgi:hypothetical protein
LNRAARAGESAGAVLTARQRRRLVVEATLRVAVTVVVLGTLYFVLPLDHAADAVTVATITLGVVGIVVVVAWQLRAITRSKYPNVRAVEALAFTIPLYLAAVRDGLLRDGSRRLDELRDTVDPDGLVVLRSDDFLDGRLR